MKAAKTFQTLEKLYEKKAALEKQIADLEKKVIMDLEKKLMAEVKSNARPALPAVKKPVAKKSTAKKPGPKKAAKPKKVK